MSMREQRFLFWLAWVSPLVCASAAVAGGATLSRVLLLAGCLSAYLLYMLGALFNHRKKVFLLFFFFCFFLFALVRMDGILAAATFGYLVSAAYYLYRVLAVPSMSEIVAERVFLGNACAASSAALLEDAGITHVLELFSGRKNPGDIRTVVTRQVDFPDDGTQRLRTIIGPCLDFVQTALDQSPQNRILIHCSAGVSRSPSIVIAHLISYRRMTIDAAEEMVRRARPIVDPNGAYRACLLEI